MDSNNRSSSRRALRPASSSRSAAVGILGGSIFFGSHKATQIIRKKIDYPSSQVPGSIDSLFLEIGYLT